VHVCSDRSDTSDIASEARYLFDPSDPTGKSTRSFACFDTTFHATMPPTASRYAISSELREKGGIKRYGFHGLSYAFVVRRLAAIMYPEDQKGTDKINAIVMHLGNGASICAVKEGKSIDTSMGLTPFEGQLPWPITAL